VLEKRTYKDAVDADWKLSREYGITGCAHVRDRPLRRGRGAQPYEALEQLVRKATTPEE
jgi:predicted DsbA family dithiol-disulfide isomerase